MNKQLTFTLTLIGIFATLVTFGQVNITDLNRAKSGRWTKQGETKPFSGDFVEYHANNTIKGKGTLKDGLVEGFRVVFDENGDTAFFRHYIQGISNGASKEFFPHNKLKQDGSYTDGKENGTWKFYYENGNLEALIDFKNGIQDGNYTEYNIDGSMKVKYVFKDGKVTYGKEIDALVDKAIQHSEKGENEKAIKLYDKAIEINASIAPLYFNRATCKLNMLNKKYIPEAIKDFDKAIEINPNYMEAYGNRGNAKINMLTTNGALKPTAEQTKSACEDFQKAKQLGDKSVATEDMLYLYCSKKD